MEDNKTMTTITVTHNGPLSVENGFKLIDKDGTETILLDKTALCRCGCSHKRPYCDGTHAKINFDDTKECKCG